MHVESLVEPYGAMVWTFGGAMAQSRKVGASSLQFFDHNIIIQAHKATPRLCASLGKPYINRKLSGSAVH